MNAGGTLENGSGAVSAVRTFEGGYIVTFDRDVIDCAPVVTKGSHAGGSTNLSVVPFASTGGSAGPSEVRVDFREPVAPFDPHDTDFHLVVAC